MKTRYHNNFLPSILISLFIISCSDTNEENNDEIIITPIPQTNSLYTSMQWETSDPLEEGMDPEILETAFINGFSDGSFTQAALVIRNERIVYEEYRGIAEGEKQTLIDGGTPEEIIEKYDICTLN